MSSQDALLRPRLTSKDVEVVYSKVELAWHKVDATQLKDIEQYLTKVYDDPSYLIRLKVQAKCVAQVVLSLADTSKPCILSCCIDERHVNAELLAYSAVACFLRDFNNFSNIVVRYSARKAFRNVLDDFTVLHSYPFREMVTSDKDDSYKDDMFYFSIDPKFVWPLLDINDCLFSRSAQTCL